MLFLFRLNLKDVQKYHFYGMCANNYLEQGFALININNRYLENKELKKSSKLNLEKVFGAFVLNLFQFL